MNFLHFMSMFLTMYLLSATHPLILVIMISAQSLCVSFLIWSYFLTSWFPLVLFLIFMGGLMVLFIYISSLASNEMFVFNQKTMLTILSSSFIIIGLSNYQQMNNNKNINTNFKEMIFKIYSTPSSNLTFMIMVYLLVVLIITVSVISMYEGPLRNTSL